MASDHVVKCTVILRDANVEDLTAATCDRDGSGKRGTLGELRDACPSCAGVPEVNGCAAVNARSARARLQPLDRHAPETMFVHLRVDELPLLLVDLGALDPNDDFVVDPTWTSRRPSA